MSKPRAAVTNDVRYKPKRGQVWNPLLGYPRNAECFCGSQKKFKACHVNFVTATCKAKDAETINQMMPDLIAGRTILRAARPGEIEARPEDAA